MTEEQLVHNQMLLKQAARFPQRLLLRPLKRRKATDASFGNPLSRAASAYIVLVLVDVLVEVLVDESVEEVVVDADGAVLLVLVEVVVGSPLIAGVHSIETLKRV